MKININSQVTVRLTEAGQAKWCSYYSVEEIANTITEPLWEIMQVFGSGLHMGMSEMYFVNNELEIIE